MAAAARWWWWWSVVWAGRSWVLRRAIVSHVVRRWRRRRYLGREPGWWWPEVGVGRPARGVASGLRAAVGAATHGPAAVVLGRGFGSLRPMPPRAVAFTSVTGLAVALPHTDVAPYSDARALLGHGAAERRARGQAGELLGAVDGEVGRLELHAPVERGALGLAVVRVLVGVLLGLLVQIEGKLVAALVADRQIGEQKVAGLLRPVEVGHARDGHAGQDGRCARLGRLAAGVGDDAGVLERGEEEEVGVVGEGDVTGLVAPRTLKDAKLDDGRRVDRTAIRGSCVRREAKCQFGSCCSDT